jgi:Listeria/Bacterioides repeat
MITADHTLTYNANGGSGAPDSETKTYSVTSPTFFTVSSTQPSRTGYTFMGWSSSAGGSAEYSAGDTIPASADKTLYAVWQINTYPVNYNANGGVGAPAAQTKTYGVSLTLSSMQPTRDGYNFLGWAESASATEAEYEPGGSYTKNQAKTLYAVWQIRTYTVHFDAAGGSAAPADQTKVHGETLVLSSYIPRLQGYRFRGWGACAECGDGRIRSRR